VWFLSQLSGTVVVRSDDCPSDNPDTCTSIGIRRQFFRRMKNRGFFAPAESNKVFHACLLKGTYDVHTEKNLVL
jgi:hypothetical protein